LIGRIDDLRAAGAHALAALFFAPRPTALQHGFSRLLSAENEGTWCVNTASRLFEREGRAMTKNDLIVQVSETSNLTRLQATAAVEAAFDLITRALKAGDEVKIIGFGTFSVSNRAAREGRNPRTGEPVQIAASRAVKFSSGKGLKDALNRDA
jgi:DNA-binding protein HU-beta